MAGATAGAGGVAGAGGEPEFAVVDPCSRQLQGIVGSSDVAQAVERNQWASPLSDIMRPAGEVPTVTSNTPLLEVQDKLAQGSSRVAAVYDGPFFQGLISTDDVRRVFRFISRGGSLTERASWKTSG